MTDTETVAILGVGTIGLSFAALHLTHSSHKIVIFDTRPELSSYIDRTLPKYLLPTTSSIPSSLTPRITLATSLSSAVSKATIVQECLPENPALKTAIWPDIEAHAPPNALLWSSTSGILASTQAARMNDKSRLLVVHPFNPPHIMPILELVPSPSTAPAFVERTLAYWRALGRAPVVVKQERAGFVANRLAFALLKEAVYLVGAGVVSAPELDTIVTTSMGPRWAIAGPFESYTAGGGEGGLEAFFKNIGGTVQQCWDDAGQVRVDGEAVKEACRQAGEAYGVVDTSLRDRITRRVLEVIEDERRRVV